MNNERDILTIGLTELGFSTSPERLGGILQYLDILETINQSFNLTRIPRNEYVTLHVLDSLMALPLIPVRPALSILDIGTGAGFPGVPLAALLPHAQVFLLDSTAKKVRFAADTAHACGFTNCSALHCRAEALAKDPKHRGRYDVVVSRAVASFDTLIQLMLPLVKPGGLAIALKGSKAYQELQGTERIVEKLRGRPAKVYTERIPTTDIERHLIVVEKGR